MMRLKKYIYIFKKRVEQRIFSPDDIIMNAEHRCNNHFDNSVILDYDMYI